LTIIVFDPVKDRIYVDQGVTWMQGRKMTYSSKIYKLGAHRIALSGNTSEFDVCREAIIAALDGGAFESRRTPKDYNIEGFARLANGKAVLVHIQDSIVVASEWEYQVPFATGSGGMYAYAYMTLGYGPLEATRLTAQHHSECGGDVEEF